MAVAIWQNKLNEGQPIRQVGVASTKWPLPTVNVRNPLPEDLIFNPQIQVHCETVALLTPAQKEVTIKYIPDFATFFIFWYRLSLCF